MAEKPVFSLPVAAGPSASTGALNTEINRVVNEVWKAAVVAGLGTPEAEELAQQVQESASAAAEQVGLAATQVGLAAAQVGLAAAERSAAQSAKAQAEVARAEAEGYATGAAVVGGWFDTIALGRAAVADAETFGVRANGSDGLIRPTIYRRDSSSTQTLIVELPRGTEVDDLTARVAPVEDAVQGLSANAPQIMGDEVWGLADILRRVAVALHADGKFRVAKLVTEAGELAGITSLGIGAATIGHASTQWAVAWADAVKRVAMALSHDGALHLSKLAFGGLSGDAPVVLDRTNSDWDFAIADGARNVVFGIKDGVVHAVGVSSANDTVAVIDRRNHDHAARVRARRLHVQQPIADLNVVHSYGQSLMEGNETWPSLSKSPVIGALMVGGSVDNVAGAAPYTPIGTAALNPMAARTRNASGVLLTDAQEAALTAGDQAAGEPPVIALTNGLRRWMLRHGLTSDDGRKCVALNASIGGRTVAQLSKGASTGHYGLVTSGVELVQSLAGDQSVVVSAIAWAQGEYDYDYTSGGATASSERDDYAALLDALFDDMRDDLMDLTGQELPPLILSYQTGAGYTRDASAAGTVGLNVGMAQLDVVLARDDATMVGPVYPVTDQGGHLDANGSRWLGWYYAKVARKVLIEGEGWEPLRPIEVTTTGRDILIGYHVPCPPLAFRAPYVVNAATTYAHKGFRVTSADGVTARTITSVEIVAPTVIKLTLSEPPQPDDILWYAPKTTMNGNGMVADSDPEVAWDRYEYVPERGMYSSANIATLVGKPYPLHNWSVAFSLPLNYSEVAP